MTGRLGIFTPCPACGYRTDTHSAVGPYDVRPKAGDASICLRCGQLLLFTLDFIGLRLRLPATPELEQLIDDDRIATLVAAWVQLNGRTPEMRTA